MKQNILVVSYDYSLSKNICNKLADIFSMRTLDQFEMFDFNHIPRTFSEVLTSSGNEYVKKELRGIIKMELDFDNVVFAADISLGETCKDIFFRIKLSNFVVFVTKNINTEMNELDKKEYESKAVKKYFSMNKKTLSDRESSIKFDLADAVIDADDLTDDQIARKIELEVLKYYKVD